MSEEMTLDEAFKKLEGLTKKMEEGSLSLEETFDLYKEGLGLVEYCEGKIEKVESDIKILNGAEENNGQGTSL